MCNNFFKRRRKGDPICLTYEHKASDPREVERIISAGGFVSQDRVSGMLAVSRALGDDGMKEHVIGSPFTSEIVLTQDDEWIIVACDGVCIFNFSFGMYVAMRNL